MSASKSIAAISAAPMTPRISHLRTVPLQEEGCNQGYHNDRRLDGCSRRYRHKRSAVSDLTRAARRFCLVREAKDVATTSKTHGLGWQVGPHFFDCCLPPRAGASGNGVDSLARVGP